MDEVWRVYPEFKNYEVSNTGKVRNVKSKHELSPYYNRRNGTLMVFMRIGGMSMKRSLYKLVATMFIPNPNLHTNVKNLNCPNKSLIENLVWYTPTYTLKTIWFNKTNNKKEKGNGKII